MAKFGMVGELRGRSACKQQVRQQAHALQQVVVLVNEKGGSFQMGLQAMLWGHVQQL